MTAESRAIAGENFIQIGWMVLELSQIKPGISGHFRRKTPKFIQTFEPSTQNLGPVFIDNYWSLKLAAIEGNPALVNDDEVLKHSSPKLCENFFTQLQSTGHRKRRRRRSSFRDRRLSSHQVEKGVRYIGQSEGGQKQRCNVRQQ